MAELDQAYVSNIDPTFAAVDSGRATVLIQIASAQVSAAVWGELYDYACALLTLHTWVLGQTRGSGPVTREVLGDMETSYATPKGGANDLASTSWGVEYLRIGRSRVKGPLVTGDAE